MYSSVSLGALCLGGAGRGVDLDAAAAENQAFLSTRTTEKKEMIALNDRLAVYIEKVSLGLTLTSFICDDHLVIFGLCSSQVRSLEQSNKLLEAEIDAIKGQYVKPSGLRKLYEDQLRELKRIADQMKVQRVRE